MPCPATANIICDKAGAKNAWGYDLNAACSGFIYALATGAQYIQTGMHKKVVVVGADMMSSIINYEDRTTCIIFGDRSEEHTSELQSLMRISYAVFCLTKKTKKTYTTNT